MTAPSPELLDDFASDVFDVEVELDELRCRL
jgi:hypothetical protein